MSNAIEQIRVSPVLFLIRLFVVEFLGALVYFMTRFFLVYQDIVNGVSLIDLISSSLLMVLLLSLIQVMAIMLLFYLWYTEIYLIDNESIKFRRLGMFYDKQVVLLDQIKKIEVNQSRLGQYFNYGDIRIWWQNNKPPVRLGFIPNSAAVAQLIKKRSALSSQQLDKFFKNKISFYLEKGEGQQIEFKSGWQYDYNKKTKNKDLKIALMKNIAGMLNSDGGVILIGVTDKKEIIGLDKDLELLDKPTTDRLENSINMSFRSSIGNEFHKYISLEFLEKNKKKICKINIRRASEPAYLKFEDKEEFYIRTGNSSQALSVRAAASYIASSF